MDRLVGWFRSVVREMTSDLPYAGSYRYEVAAQNVDAQTLDLKPLGHTQPALEGVAMRTPGLKLSVKIGSDVVVCFANNDPTLPYVFAYSQDPADIEAVEILGETARNAREGDTVNIGIILDSLNQPCTQPPPDPPPPGVAITGTITSGSDKVSS